jgi:hypothetical protein
MREEDGVVCGHFFSKNQDSTENEGNFNAPHFLTNFLT